MLAGDSVHWTGSSLKAVVIVALFLAIIFITGPGTSNKCVIVKHCEDAILPVFCFFFYEVEGVTAMSASLSWLHMTMDLNTARRFQAVGHLYGQEDPP